MKICKEIFNSYQYNAVILFSKQIQRKANSMYHKLAPGLFIFHVDEQLLNFSDQEQIYVNVQVNLTNFHIQYQSPV
jgi:hypothetical protein